MSLATDVAALNPNPSIGADHHVDTHATLAQAVQDFETRITSVEGVLPTKASASSVTTLQNTAVTTGSAASLASLVVTSYVKNATYTTTLRPSAVTLGAGAQVYDTTLGLPIFSDGTIWRNALGTAV